MQLIFIIFNSSWAGTNNSFTWKTRYVEISSHCIKFSMNQTQYIVRHRIQISFAEICNLKVMITNGHFLLAQFRHISGFDWLHFSMESVHDFIFSGAWLHCFFLRTHFPWYNTITCIRYNSPFSLNPKNTYPLNLLPYKPVKRALIYHNASYSLLHLIKSTSFIHFREATIIHLFWILKDAKNSICFQSVLVFPHIFLLFF